MRRAQLAMGLVAVLASALLLAPLAIGTTRRALGRGRPGDHVLIVTRGGVCVAPAEDFCAPVWEYPAFVPGWYDRALTRSP